MLQSRLQINAGRLQLRSLSSRDVVAKLGLGCLCATYRGRGRRSNPEDLPYLEEVVGPHTVCLAIALEAVAEAPRSYDTILSEPRRIRPRP